MQDRSCTPGIFDGFFSGFWDALVKGSSSSSSRSIAPAPTEDEARRPDLRLVNNMERPKRAEIAFEDEDVHSSSKSTDLPTADPPPQADSTVHEKGPNPEESQLEVPVVKVVDQHGVHLSATQRSFNRFMVTGRARLVSKAGLSSMVQTKRRTKSLDYDQRGGSHSSLLSVRRNSAGDWRDMAGRSTSAFLPSLVDGKLQHDETDTDSDGDAVKETKSSSADATATDASSKQRVSSLVENGSRQEHDESGVVVEEPESEPAEPKAAGGRFARIVTVNRERRQQRIEKRMQEVFSSDIDQRFGVSAETSTTRSSARQRGLRPISALAHSYSARDEERERKRQELDQRIAARAHRYTNMGTRSSRASSVGTDGDRDLTTAPRLRASSDAMDARALTGSRLLEALPDDSQVREMVGSHVDVGDNAVEAKADTDLLSGLAGSDAREGLAERLRRLRQEEESLQEQLERNDGGHGAVGGKSPRLDSAPAGNTLSPPHIKHAKHAKNRKLISQRLGKSSLPDQVEHQARLRGLGLRRAGERDGEDIAAVLEQLQSEEEQLSHELGGSSGPIAVQTQRLPIQSRARAGSDVALDPSHEAHMASLKYIATGPGKEKRRSLTTDYSVRDNSEASERRRLLRLAYQPTAKRSDSPRL